MRSSIDVRMGPWARLDNYVLLNHGAVWSIGAHKSLAVAALCATVEGLLAWGVPAWTPSPYVQTAIINAELLLGGFLVAYWTFGHGISAGATGKVLRASHLVPLVIIAMLFWLLVFSGPLLLSLRLEYLGPDTEQGWCFRDLVLFTYPACSFVAATIVMCLRPVPLIMNFLLLLSWILSGWLCVIAHGFAEPVRTALCGGPVILGLVICLCLRRGVALLGRWSGLWAVFGLALVPWVPRGRPISELWMHSGRTHDQFVGWLLLSLVQTAAYMYFYYRAFRWYDVKPHRGY